MKKRHIILVGAGQMGRSALSILARRLPAATFLVIDRSDQNLNQAVSLASDRIRACLLDITQQPFDARGADLVINFAGPFFLGSDAAARAAIAGEAAYLDACDDVDGTQTILSLDAEAKSAGVTSITGAGLSPGISNWIACHLLAEHPECDGIKIVWIVRENDPGGLAVLRHMLHMTVAPCPIWRDGKMEYSKGFVPETAETFTTPQPFGTVEALDTAHPEPITMARRYPQLRLIQCKGSVQPSWANQAFSTLGRMGFGHHDLQIEIGGLKIEPAEFLWRLLWERHRRRPARERSATTMINVMGMQGDRPVVMRTIWDDADMSRGTGLGVAAAALTLMSNGTAPGAAGVEALPAEQGLEAFFSLAEHEGAFRAGVIERAL